MGQPREKQVSVKYDYSTQNIQHLTIAEAIRKRPGMYVGDTTQFMSLHHALAEVVEASIAEAMLGCCDELAITIEDDLIVSVEDNGRGMNPALEPGQEISHIEWVLTGMAGAYNTGGPWITAPLSAWFEVTSWREGWTWHQEYDRGRPRGHVRRGAPSERTGTSMRFCLDREIFTGGVKFDFEQLVGWLRERMVEAPFTRCVVQDRRTDQRIVLGASQGLTGWARERARQGGCREWGLQREPIRLARRVEKHGVSLECVLLWTDRTQHIERASAFGRPCYHGADTLDAMRQGVTEVIEALARQRSEQAPTWAQLSRGLIAAIAFTREFTEGAYRGARPSGSEYLSTCFGELARVMVVEQLGRELERHPGLLDDLLERGRT